MLRSKAKAPEKGITPTDTLRLEILNAHIREYHDDPFRTKAACGAVAGILEKAGENSGLINMARTLELISGKRANDELEQRHRKFIRRSSFWLRRDLLASKDRWIAGEYTHFTRLAEEEVARLMKDVPGDGA